MNFFSVIFRVKSCFSSIFWASGCVNFWVVVGVFLAGSNQKFTQKFTHQEFTHKIHARNSRTKNSHTKFTHEIHAPKIHAQNSRTKFTHQKFTQKIHARNSRKGGATRKGMSMIHAKNAGRFQTQFHEHLHRSRSQGPGPRSPDWVVPQSSGRFERPFWRKNDNNQNVNDSCKKIWLGPSTIS